MEDDEYNSSSDIEESPILVIPERKDLEEYINRSISNNDGSTSNHLTTEEIDDCTERSLSPNQMGEEDDDEEDDDDISELPFQMTGTLNPADNRDLSIVHIYKTTENNGPLFSWYESLKEEGFVIPTATTTADGSKIDQVYICSEEGCNGRFSKRAYLEQHMCIHTRDRPFTCANEGCDKSYKRKDHLNRHVKYCPLSPGGGLPPVPCTIEGCDRTFINETNLRKHLQVYHENKKKKIQSLLAAYSDVVRADRFKNSNDEEKEGDGEEVVVTRNPEFDLSSQTPFRCPHPGCEMSFKWMNRLRRHMKVHEGYPCPQCGEKFEKWPQLVRHKTAAHKEPQKCPVCEKTFAQGQWLKRHMKVHSDVREMYLCPYEECRRCYSEKRNLDAHIRSYHYKLRFYCVFEDCGRSFAFKHKMLDHLKMHCNNITEEDELSSANLYQTESTFDS